MEGRDGFMNKLSTQLFVTKVYRVLSWFFSLKLDRLTFAGPMEDLFLGFAGRIGGGSHVLSLVVVPCSCGENLINCP